MTRPVLRRLLAAAALSAASSVPVAAADFEHLLLDRFSVTVGGYFLSSDTLLRVDGRNLGIGDQIDFENDLALDDTETSVRLDLEWRFRPRHQLSLTYYGFDRSAVTRVNRELRFGDVTIPVAADVTTTFDTEVSSLSYTYWFMMRERTVLGVTAGGVNVISFDATVGVAGGGLALFENAGADLPVPLIGFELRHALLDRLAIHVALGLIPEIEIDNASGDAIDAALSLEYRFLPSVALGAAYNLFDLDVDNEERRFRGNLDFRVSGANLYLRLGL